MPIYILRKGKNGTSRIRKRDETMGLNVSTSMGFENREQLKNTARNILKNGGASSEASSKIVDETIFNNKRAYTDMYSNSQLSIIKASTQISLNSSLKETLKYLKSHSNRKVEKQAVFGEIWNSFSENTNNQETVELFEFEIDENVENIFAAA